MLNRIIKTLSSYDTPRKVCVIGNEAVARGAIEAGVRGVFAYPGTPSTEISEVFKHVNAFRNNPIYRDKYRQLTADPIYFEYSINEKIALEKAIAYSIGNRNAMCCMKNVGLNVASDALMTIAYQTIGAALVLIVCDDPGCYSSSNEQDSRYWGKMASVPVFNPATSRDAHQMVKEAFALSGEIKLPVIVRMTTRVGHTRGIVHYGRVSGAEQAAKFEKLPQHINIPARTASAHRNLLDKLNSETIDAFQEKNCTLSISKSSALTTQKIGIIASGVPAAYTSEIVSRLDCMDKVDLLTPGLICPFPKKEVLKFLKTGYQKILILEELDPLIENDVRILAQKNSISTEISGKGFAGLSPTGEYNLDIVQTAIAEFTGMDQRRYLESPSHRHCEASSTKQSPGSAQEIASSKTPRNDGLVFCSKGWHEGPCGTRNDKKEKIPLPNAADFLKDLPPRPPTLCPGCPHRATFYTLKLAVPRENGKIVLCGDIGCFGLGALPPLQMIDTIHHMGMSISMAQGLAEAFQQNTDERKFVALVGDGTFFHSGIPSLLNAVYTRANIAVIIFDNRTISMTGQQDHPGAPQSTHYNQIDLPALLQGLGVQHVETVNAFDLKDSYKKMTAALACNGVSVIISKSPCILIPEIKKSLPRNGAIIVDHERCNTCHNQVDASLYCSKMLQPKSGLAKARVQLNAKVHFPAKEQSCPANICNHGFFAAIQAGDYGEALNIVRDKMLFARVCGDICHKPCESLYLDGKQPIVPIRSLKHFVAGIEAHFNDFSIPQKRAASAQKRNKHIAIVGAGPAGLSAAYDLVQAGYFVTVFDKEAQAGGLLSFAIPDFRMDKMGLEKEISILNELGVKFKFDTSLGKDIQLEALATDYDAVIVAIGMGIYPTLDMVEKNVPAAMKFNAVPFLRQYNNKTLEMKVGTRILVIGGGNSAMDAARAAKRYDAKNDVIVSCLETFDKMPAFNEEIHAAIEEQIEIIDGSHVSACDLEATKSLKIALNSFNDDKHITDLYCDYIITAIGQRGDQNAIDALLPVDENERILADSETGQTKYKNVFVAGDICADSHVSLIGAIAGAKKAAVGVRKLLENYDFPYEGQAALSILCASRPAEYKPAPEPNGKTAPSDAINRLPVIDLFQACAKCNHCIDNFGCPALIKVNGKVEIDLTQCTLCGLCIDVCINGAIKWAPTLVKIEA